MSAVPASSRVNPLPQVQHSIQNLCSTCGSGFTRERASADNTIFTDLAQRFVPPQPLQYFLSAGKSAIPT